jgi:hypothetical protein
MALPILCLLITACAKPDDRARASDPNAPAVVKAPPPVLPSDTAKKEVPPVVTDDDARMTMSRGYALVAAGMSMMDPKLVMSAYGQDTKLTTPNGSFTGRQAIMKEYLSFGMDGSVKQFQRQSRVLKVVDSTVADSGLYMVVRKKRASPDSTIEVGSYASVWRIHAPPADWLMTQDHLYPAKPVITKQKK